MCNKNSPEQNNSILDLKAFRVNNVDSIFRTNKTLKNKVTDNFHSAPNTFSRTVTSSNYGFSIDTTRVQIIKSGSYESYTFVVERETYDPNILENYVLTLFDNGSYSQLLAVYPITVSADGKFSYNMANATSQFINDVSLVGRDLEPCPNDTVPISAWDESAGECVAVACTAGGNHLPGEPCNGSPDQLAYWDCEGGWVTSCVTAGTGGDDGSGDDGTGTGGGTTTTDPDPSPEDGDIAVLPLAPTYINNIITCLNGISLIGESPENNFVYEDFSGFTEAQLAEMHGYLIRLNGCSTEAKEFVIAAKDAWLDGGEVDFDAEIIITEDFENHARLKCVYDKFKLGNNTISNYLENFLGEHPVAHLKFTADPNFHINQPPQHHGAGAITVEPQNYIIEIIFNTDPNLSASADYFPTIILASDLIHEMIHAELYRKLLSLAQEGSIPWSISFINSIKNNYPGLYDYYMRWKYNMPSGISAASPQHQMMAENYRNLIIAALKDFDNNAHEDTVYETLSWSGLIGTVAWNNLSPEDQSDLEFNFDNIKNNETFDCN